MEVNLFEKIKNVLGLSDVLSHYGHSTDKDGKWDCPFHNDTPPNDFHVTNDEIGYCWSCRNWGDVLKVLLEKEGDWGSVFRKASELTGIEISLGDKTSDELNQMKRERELGLRRVECLTAATEIFHKNLSSEKREEIKLERGWTDKTIDKFKIGYSKRNIRSDLQKLGFTDSEIEGGVSVSSFDFFNERIVFPYQKNNKTFYMIGRKTDKTPDNKWEQGKFKKLKKDYLENPIFNTDSLKKDEQLFITEGMPDAISIDQAGYPCISPITIRFKKSDFPKLLKYSAGKDVYIANDNEENNSGQDGSTATAKYLFENGIANVQIITIPKPKKIDKIDMCDYLKKKTNTIKKLIEDCSQHILDFEISKIKGANDFGRISTALELMASTNKVPLDSFLKHFKEKSGISPSSADKQIKKIISDEKEKEKEKILLESQRQKAIELEQSLREQEKAVVPEDCLLELKDIDLLDNAIKQIQEMSGVVGERDSIKAVLIAQAGAFVKNNKTASYNMIITSKSGAGKDFLTSATSKIWPKEICIKRTRISPQAFTYWHNAKFEPEWTWDGKILILEDVSNMVLNSDTFKVMQSSGSIATIVINNQAVDIIVKGKPVMIVTTAKSSPNLEMVRRNSMCEMDESEEHTKKILQKQAKEADLGVNNVFDRDLRKALKFLKRVNVRVPFADKFVTEFPTKHLIMRTAFNRFIDFVRASAAFNQYKRDRDENGNVMATGEDYDVATDILRHLTKDGNMVQTTRDQRTIIEILKSGGWTTVDTIIGSVPMSDKWLRTQLDRMVELDLLESSGIKEEKIDKFGNISKGRVVKNYRALAATNKIDLKSYKQICENTTIDTTQTKDTINTKDTMNGKKSVENLQDIQSEGKIKRTLNVLYGTSRDATEKKLQKPKENEFEEVLL